MAESALALELAESLAQEDIPIKLRCASCNKLVVNAFRLPCCDQSVCEPCQQNLPNECPVCAHSPLSGDDCKPNKALRLTVRAFLKNEEKKRDKGKEAQNEAPLISATHEVGTSQEPSGKLDEGQGESTVVAAVVDASTPLTESASKTQSGDDIKTSIETPEDTTEIKEESVTIPESEEGVAGGNEDAENQFESNQNIGHQQSNNNIDFGMSGAANNQMWNPGDFNPAMAMQNNMMNPAVFGGFSNMMGMPMGMDPMMMSQGMFGGFNGAGMGMGGMNMGMGFDGNMGGWGNQASMGMMNGDFGTNTGFFSGGGYNHHQSNHMHNQQFQNERYHHNRFNRGRGYFQRGGYNRDRGRPSNYNSSYGWNQQPRPVNGTGGNITTDTYSNGQAEATPRDESVQPSGVNNLGEPNDIQDTEPSQQADTATTETRQVPVVARDCTAETASDIKAGIAETEVNQESGLSAESRDAIKDNLDNIKPGTGFVNVDPDVTLRAPQGPSAHFMPNHGPDFVARGRGGFRGNYRGGFRGRGGFHQDQLPVQSPVPGVAGAPTGPKAMREGFPNTGIRGRGGFQAGRGVPTGPSAGILRPQTRERAGEEQVLPEETQNPASRESRLRSRSRSRSRSPATRENEYHQSRSPNERFTQSESRFNDDGDDNYDQGGRRSSRYADDPHDGRRKDYVHDGRGSISREDSADEFRSRGHKQREDKPRSSRRGRDRSRSNSRGYKHRRHRSRSAQNAGRRERERSDRDRETHKRSRRERSSSIDIRERRVRGDDNDRHHRRHYSSRSRGHGAEEASQTAQPANPQREFKIAGRSKVGQHQPTLGSDRKPDAPTAEESVDPYLAERLQRDRERMAKEQESRGLTSDGRSDRKRSFAEGTGANGDDRNGNQRRRLSYYGEDSSGLHKGQRAEGKRDGRRWR